MQKGFSLPLWLAFLAQTNLSDGHWQTLHLESLIRLLLPSSYLLANLKVNLTLFWHFFN